MTVKVEGYVFLVIGVFLGGTGLVYWFLSEDPTGTAALAISFGLGTLVGGYLLFTSRRIGPRPQDLPDAEVADGAGELGHFSPGSYWPFFIGATATLFVLGIVIGLWMMILGVALLVIAVTALLFEHYVNQPVARD